MIRAPGLPGRSRYKQASLSLGLWPLLARELREGTERDRRRETGEAAHRYWPFSALPERDKRPVTWLGRLTAGAATSLLPLWGHLFVGPHVTSC